MDNHSLNLKGFFWLLAVISVSDGNNKSYSSVLVLNRSKSGPPASLSGQHAQDCPLCACCTRRVTIPQAPNPPLVTSAPGTASHSPEEPTRWRWSSVIRTRL